MSATATLSEVFRQNLTRLAAQKGATQRDIADFMGVTTATVSCWMTGHKVPRMKKLDKLCNYFNVSRMELLGLEDTSRPKLDEVEGRLLSDFRKLSKANQQMISSIMAAFLVQQAAERFGDVIHQQERGDSSD